MSLNKNGCCEVCIGFIHHWCIGLDYERPAADPGLERTPIYHLLEFYRKNILFWNTLAILSSTMEVGGLG